MSKLKARTKGRHPAATGIIEQDINVMDERGAARYLGVSADVLRLWRSRSNDQGPVFFRAGQKLVRYRKVDLDRWIEERLSRQPVQNPETAAVHGGDDGVMTPAQNRADPTQVETLSKGRITQA